MVAKYSSKDWHSELLNKILKLPRIKNILENIQKSSPEFLILCTVDEDIEGAVASEEEVADRDHDAQAGDPDWRQEGTYNID